MMRTAPRAAWPGLALAVLALAVLALAVLAIGPCHAAGCDDATTQSAMNECASASLKRSDAALNKAYQTIMLRLKDDADAKRLLTAAQRAWVGFRDGECGFAASKVSGGSMAGMVVTTCRDTLTKQRLKQLETYLHCEEGDVTCPVPAN